MARQEARAEGRTGTRNNEARALEGAARVILGQAQRDPRTGRGIPDRLLPPVGRVAGGENPTHRNPPPIPLSDPSGHPPHKGEGNRTLFTKPDLDDMGHDVSIPSPCAGARSADEGLFRKNTLDEMTVGRTEKPLNTKGKLPEKPVLPGPSSPQRGEDGSPQEAKPDGELGEGGRRPQTPPPRQARRRLLRGCRRRETAEKDQGKDGTTGPLTPSARMPLIRPIADTSLPFETGRRNQRRPPSSPLPACGERARVRGKPAKNVHPQKCTMARPANIG